MKQKLTEKLVKPKFQEGSENRIKALMERMVDAMSGKSCSIPSPSEVSDCSGLEGEIGGMEQYSKRDLVEGLFPRDTWYGEFEDEDDGVIEDESEDEEYEVDESGTGLSLERRGRFGEKIQEMKDEHRTKKQANDAAKAKHEETKAIQKEFDAIEKAEYKNEKSIAKSKAKAEKAKVKALNASQRKHAKRLRKAIDKVLGFRQEGMLCVLLLLWWGLCLMYLVILVMKRIAQKVGKAFVKKFRKS